MNECAICGNDKGEHTNICPKCFPIIEPLIKARKEQLARLRLRRENATADNLANKDW